MFNSNHKMIIILPANEMILFIIKAGVVIVVSATVFLKTPVIMSRLPFQDLGREQILLASSNSTKAAYS